MPMGSKSTFSIYRLPSNRTTSIKLHFEWLAKKDNLIVLNQFKGFGINLNAQHTNGMTPFDLSMYGYLMVDFIIS